MTEEPRQETRVTATDDALALIAEIRRDHPDILIHQSGGCCDGSSPMCYPAGDFRIGENDVLLGWIGPVPVYIAAASTRRGNTLGSFSTRCRAGGGMFSLDNGRERRFLVRSRLLPQA